MYYTNFMETKQQCIKKKEIKKDLKIWKYLNKSVYGAK